jgi:uncharacterized membrane protein YfcA
MELLEIILYLMIGFGAAIIGALLGVGGGFLMVPILIFMGFSKDYAPVISLFVILFIALSASIKYAHKKIINYRLGLLYAPFTILGALLGAYLLHLVNNLIFKIAFSGLILYAGIRLILSRKEPQDPKTEPPQANRRSYYWIVLWGFLTGVSASFLGIGGGLIAVPVLTLFFLESMHIAIATSLFIMIFTAAFSSLQHYLLGFFDLPLLYVGLVVAVGAVLGAQLGSSIQSHLKARQLQILFGFFMMAIALPLLWLGP